MSSRVRACLREGHRGDTSNAPRGSQNPGLGTQGEAFCSAPGPWVALAAERGQRVFLPVLFYLFALGVLLSALSVVTRKNPIASAVSLVCCFFFLSALYALLDAHFVAVTQVLVYAGAIMVLFLFVTMLLNLQEHELGGSRWSVGKVLAALGAAFITWRLVAILMRTDGAVPGFEVTEIPTATLQNIGTIENVGRLIFAKYLLPFEITSVLILAAIVASVVIAKKRI